MYAVYANHPLCSVPKMPVHVPMLSLKLTMQDRGVTAAVAGEATYGTHGAPVGNHFFSLQKSCCMCVYRHAWSKSGCTRTLFWLCELTALYRLCELLTFEAPGSFDQHNDPPDENDDQTDCKNYPQDGTETAIGGNTEISHCWRFFCLYQTSYYFCLV